MAKTQVIKVHSDQKKPEPVEIIAKHIIEVAAAFKRISKSGLKQRAIVLLIHDMVKNKGVGMNQIEAILDATPKLAQYYIDTQDKGGK